MIRKAATHCTEAWYSDDKLHRFDLQWRWGGGRLLVGWLLNPSTATEIVLDPTVRRIMVEADRLELDGFRIINLYALRSSKAQLALRETVAIQEENEGRIVEVLTEAVRENWQVLAGWGEDGRHKQDWALAVAREVGVELHRFGDLTKANGTPRHPSRSGDGDTHPYVRWKY